MSAELVDPFATHEPDLTPEEWAAIQAEVLDRPWEDPQRFPECIQEAMRGLGEVAMRGDSFSRRTATQCLRRLAYRATTGVPFNEPGDDWPDPRESLIDREPGLRHGQYIRRVETVVEDL